MVAKIVIFTALLGAVAAHSAFSSQHIKKYEDPTQSVYGQGYDHGHGQWTDGRANGHGQRQGFGYSQAQGFGFGHAQGFGHGQGEGFGYGQRQGYGYGHGHGQGHGHKHNDHHAHPKYEFEYTVEDSHTGDHKSQQESRDGDVVHGSYSLLQPDGSIRDVQYHGDQHSGFHADVHYSTNHGQPQRDNNKHFY